MSQVVSHSGHKAEVLDMKEQQRKSPKAPQPPKAPKTPTAREAAGSLPVILHLKSLARGMPRLQETPFVGPTKGLHAKQTLGKGEGEEESNDEGEGMAAKPSLANSHYLALPGKRGSSAWLVTIAWIFTSAKASARKLRREEPKRPLPRLLNKFIRGQEK